MKKKCLNILVLEDDPLALYSLEKHVHCYSVQVKNSIDSALEVIREGYIDIVFIDMDLNYEKEGLDFLMKIKSKNIYKVLLTGRDERELIKTSYLNGANDYLVKPITSDSFNETLKRYYKWSDQNNIHDFIEENLKTNSKFLHDQIVQLIYGLNENKNCHIRGETGVGKSYLVKKVYEYLFKSKPFIEINCASLPKELIESELFGHVEGAFTGATKSKKGLMALADGGLLFLDEINSLHYSLQAKILKAIEEKRFYALGDSRQTSSNFTLVTASNEDLKKLIVEQKFREDLYYRINDVEIEIPPLRSRSEDVKDYISKIISTSSRKILIEDDALEELVHYSWPGNLRQLYKVLESIKSLDHSLITREDIIPLVKARNESYVDKKNQVGKSLQEIIANIERDIVLNTLRKNGQKVRETLNELKISQSTFYRISKGKKSE